MDQKYLDDRRQFLSDTMKDMDKGLYDNAIALANARLVSFPGDMDAYLVIASCHAGMNNPARAKEIIEQWHDIVLDQSRAYEILGDAYCRMGMSKEGVESYMKFAALNPDSPAFLSISEKLVSLQDASVEEKPGDNSDEVAAMFTNFHTLTVARLYVRQGHFKMAVDVIDRILERDPDNVEAAEYAKHVRHLMEKGWGPIVDEMERWLGALEKRQYE